LEAHDLAVAKLVAGRPKDEVFLRALLDARLLDPVIVQQRLEATDVDRARFDLAVDRLRRWAG
jgi:hypothetical protein